MVSSPALQDASPPSSPASIQNGGSPQQLTPNSKIRAMMAAIDDASESDSSSKPTTSRRDRTLRAVTPVVGQHESVAADQTGAASGGDSDGEESDDAPVAPRGRLAARMQAQDMAKNDAPNSTGDNISMGAYERIKNQLLPVQEKEPEHRVGDPLSREIDDTGAVPVKSISNRCREQVAMDPDHPQPALTDHLASQRLSPSRSITPQSSILVKSSTMVTDDDSDSDLPAEPQISNKLLELVARKKKEIDSKKVKETQKKKRPRITTDKTSKRAVTISSGNSEDDSEDKAGGDRLTQQARPTRKASKKALEEMNRETQRMSRNMQLAHQARTKKKISKESFFARFNLGVNNSPNPTAERNLISSVAASSAPGSDAEHMQEEESPPTSPIEPVDQSIKLPHLVADVCLSTTSETEPTVGKTENELPSMLDIMSQPIQKLDKGKGRAAEHVVHQIREEDIDNILPFNLKRVKKTVFTQPPIRVRPQKKVSRTDAVTLDSDSDLEILPTQRTRPVKLSVFDRLPAGKSNEGRSLQMLRALAHLTSPSKQSSRSKTSMSLSDMQISLQKRARQQAAAERAEKIRDLKDRGVIVQTAEERIQDQAAVEDLLDKARREASEIMQKEKKAAKTEKIANGEIDVLADTSDEDEDYEDNEADESNLELSGSEEEQAIEHSDSEAENLAADGEIENEGGVSVLDMQPGAESFLDKEASENCDEETQESGDDEADDHKEPHNVPVQRKRWVNRVIEDDEEEHDQDGQINLSGVISTTTEVAHKPSIPGMPIFMQPPIGVMGMTQAFAATMADTQTQGDDMNIGEIEEQDSLACLGTLPEPDFPMYDLGESQQMILDSQKGTQDRDREMEDMADASAEIDIHFSQSQVRYNVLDDTQGLPTATQYSDIPDPTQDVGFGLSSPAPERFTSVPPSTVDTLLLTARNDTPIVKKRGHLRRRTNVSAGRSDVDEAHTIPKSKAESLENTANAFEVMQQIRKEPTMVADAFDKKKSEAKRMVEEQAQESEDEYAGLGGASDDESHGEEDEEVRKMIDEGEVAVDERQLASFHANKERANDEKAVGKLFKDINNGMLRRKRGADFDLSDSDDDGEARKRAKRREFAKMRKALLANENVGKIAEDPKKIAFLRAIADREDGEENLAFLEQPEEQSSQVSLGNEIQEIANSQPHPTAILDSLALSGKRKRPLQESALDAANRPPPAARRSRQSKKPSTLAEIRQSVSFLIEEPDAVPIRTSDSSNEEEANDENPSADRDPFARRRVTGSIINRISLKRAESATAAASASSRLAFHDPSSTGSEPSFLVPSLLRRATTQLGHLADATHGITTNTATAGTERSAGGGEQKGGFVRRGGSKKSSINYFAREMERRGAVEGAVRKREEERRKRARERTGGLGGLGVGGFE